MEPFNEGYYHAGSPPNPLAAGDRPSGFRLCAGTRPGSTWHGRVTDVGVTASILLERFPDSSQLWLAQLPGYQHTGAPWKRQRLPGIFRAWNKRCYDHPSTALQRRTNGDAPRGFATGKNGLQYPDLRFACLLRK